ncbi:MAG TPA: alpha/beta fold hydrolase [Bacteroidia bacterium]|nr:alpha/beta fold hydrolase [Bacteroidia bacterium]HNS12455.1 alpha/beta fold hydrolase [Bacteroidia bacterium]
MELHYKRSGDGQPLIILHGLFGMGDNWATLSKYYAQENFDVIIPDLRNHGRSPRSNEFNYHLMAEDIHQLIRTQNLQDVCIIGHSMGGKVAMCYAGIYPEHLNKLIVVDIGTKYYPPHHQTVLAAIHAVRPENLSNRKEAEAILRDSLKEEATIQFLLKNLYWNEQEKLDWRFNIEAIEKNIEEIGKALPQSFKINIPTLFVSGEKSGYIQQKDQPDILMQFSDAKFISIPNAGHWVHAENPKDFFDQTVRFLKS